MHFNNSDKLDLTANHVQQWPRTLRAAACPTLQRGSARTATRDCVTLCLNGLISVKVWNRSDCKHLFSPSVTCYPFSRGESGERLFLPESGCQHRLEHLPVTLASQARYHGNKEARWGRRCRTWSSKSGLIILTSNTWISASTSQSIVRRNTNISSVPSPEKGANGNSELMINETLLTRKLCKICKYLKNCAQIFNLMPRNTLVLKRDTLD